MYLETLKSRDHIPSLLVTGCPQLCCPGFPSRYFTGPKACCLDARFRGLASELHQITSLRRVAIMATVTIQTQSRHLISVRLIDKGHVKGRGLVREEEIATK